MIYATHASRRAQACAPQHEDFFGCPAPPACPLDQKLYVVPKRRIDVDLLGDVLGGQTHLHGPGEQVDDLARVHVATGHKSARGAINYIIFSYIFTIYLIMNVI